MAPMSQLIRPLSARPPDLGPSSRGRLRRPARGRAVLLTLVITLAVAMVPVGASIGHALGARGQASTSVPQGGYYAGMLAPTDRYLVSSEGDFLAVTTR